MKKVIGIVGVILLALSLVIVINGKPPIGGSPEIAGKPPIGGSPVLDTAEVAPTSIITILGKPPIGG